ncbi:uncharacterized protein TRIADDRAFT_22276 [Trichoplax adhaerens]|uniref:BTB domain-containing protein n=1 Tax=Trichoplax adhaerens TaxID=10228 RepID=B3RRU2_TRIAD|nr:hypothetical protein TRIADDRAFT_22276 [Trichoplax adhaerens]EDV26409.1 hypothetical protein TRIADDRAFT_22276 [Trichoplax adhaerens]|eukprot:XP_002110405.1 hypothetical protein TRIADDRAFT_22276 [Trichoplax adhaerens]
MENCHHYYQSFAKNSFTVIRQLLSDGYLCDVELHIGQWQFPCHRLILASFSSYFRSMFTSNMIETTLHHITIHEVDQQAASMLVQYAYNGELAITKDNVQALLETAVLFDVPDVMEACSQFMSNHIDIQNCISIYNFAGFHHLTTLSNYARNYILENFTDVFQSNEIQYLSEDYLIQLLKHSKLNVQNEMQVYSAVKKWINYDYDERKLAAFKLLNHVRFAMIPRQQLILLTKNDDELINLDQHCQHLINQALRFQLYPKKVQNIETKPRESYSGLLYVFSYADVYSHYNTVECFSYKHQKWIIVHDAPKKLMSEDFAVTASEQNLYTLSGNRNHIISNQMSCYDVITKSWSAFPSVQTPRLEASICYLNQLLFVIGGYKIDYNRYTRSSRIAESYDTDTGLWTALSPMNEKRFGAGIATMDGLIYIVGGLSYDSSSTINFLNSGEYYNPKDNTWTPIRNMNYHRYKLGLVALNGYLFAIGGKSYDFECGNSFVTNSVERYDPEADEWIEITAMSEKRFAAGVATMGGRIWAIGGKCDEDNALDSAENYDPVSGEWESIPPMCNKGYNLCAISIQHKIFIS